MADKAGADSAAEAARPLAPTAEVARRLRQRAVAARGLRRAGNNRSLRRARESASGDKDALRTAWRPTSAYGSAATCAANCRRCGRTQRPSCSDVEASPNSPEAGVAHRVAGITHWFAGEYRRSARAFGTCARPVPARARRRSCLSLRTRRGRRGDVLPRDRVCGRWATSSARFPSSTRTQARIAGLAHIGTRRDWKIARGHVRTDARRPARAAPNAIELARSRVSMICRMWRACAVFSRGLGDG